MLPAGLLKQGSEGLSEKMLRKLKELYKRRAFIIIIIIALGILLVPHMVRFRYFDNYLIGEEPYYHARIAEDLSKGFFQHDTLSYAGSVYPFDSYHVLLSLFGQFIGVLTVSNLLPFVLGILSVVLLYLLLRQFRFTRNMRFIILFLWIISPIFIYTFTVSGPFSVVIFLNLAGFYFFVKDGKKSVLSILFFSFIPFFGIMCTLLTAFAAIAYAVRSKKKGFLVLVLLLLFLVSILYNGWFYYRYGLPGGASLGVENFAQSNFVELGSHVGFNIFVLLLSGIGIISTWKRKGSFMWIYLGLLVLLIISYFEPDFKMLLNILISLLSAYGLVAVVEMHWELRLIRNLTIVLLVAGMLFSSYSYMMRLSFAEPDLSRIDALVWLNDRSLPEDVVLSHYRNGFWIEYFSRRPVVMDSLTEYTPLPQQRYNDTRQLMMTRDMDVASGILDKYEVKFILVDQKTRELMQTENNLLGLQFLLENSPRFTLLKTFDSIDIWEFNQTVQSE